MASVNKVILVGNLGADPEIRYAPSGDAFCNINIATTDRWKDKQSGEKREATEWHRVVFSGRLAEIAGQYLKKGRAVYVEGALRTRKWQDQNGQDRYTTEIRAFEMQMLGSRGDTGGETSMGDDYGSQERGGGGNRPAPQASPQQGDNKPTPASGDSGGGFGDFEDDIPF